MNLFHGSYIAVPEPEIIVPVRMLDFGAGFYTTTDPTQAKKFTNKFRRTNRERILNCYRYDADKAMKNLSVLSFAKADTEWLRYVVKNRSGKGNDLDYDIVIGSVANDKVYEVVEGFEIGDYSEEEALRRLLSFRLTDQVVFKSDRSLESLSFGSAIKISEEDGDA